MHASLFSAPSIRPLNAQRGARMGFANLAKPRLSGLHYSQRLHTARVQARAELTGTLLCPLFEKPMRRRTVGKTHGQFWCCPAYPNCKGTQDIEA